MILCTPVGTFHGRIESTIEFPDEEKIKEVINEAMWRMQTLPLSHQNIKQLEDEITEKVMSMLTVKTEFVRREIVIPQKALTAAELLHKLQQYGFTDPLGHKIEMCQDFIKLVELSQKEQ
ncbi:hypothetical protein [Xenorhabdus bovienii]|uniref:hypothetical protein n=1 Tax=Xenorhabdus bovienii TaxID=40576 RepID=UPI003DA54DF3